MLPQFKRGVFPVFREIQYCRVKSFFVAVNLFALLFIGGGVALIVWPSLPVPSNSLPQTYLIFSAGILIFIGAIIPLYLYRLRLVTEVYSGEICFGFIPLPNWMKKKQYIGASTVEGYDTATFNSIAHFLKEITAKGIVRNENIYNIHSPSPIQGILLKIKNQDAIFLGTRRLDELTTALDQIIKDGR